MPTPLTLSSRRLAVSAALALSAACATADSYPVQNQAQMREVAPAEVIQLRERGPEGLAIALARYQALPDGEDKEAQALIVDKVAGQRYATASNLYWYTDLKRAKAAALDSGRPILSLRLLGRLDEDYSCANSRLFRTVLYANQEVSSYLRDNFTLHWSSEREVPKVTINFGDGREMKTTIAGNSAHYVLAQDGTPVDVLPGLYSPKAFLKALAPAHHLAMNVSGQKSKKKVLTTIQAYHNKRAAATAAQMEKMSPALQAALRPYQVRGLPKVLIAAEALTMGKAAIELPLANELAVQQPDLPLDPSAVRDALSKVESLDQSSRTLIARIGPTDWASEPSALPASAFSEMIRQLERRVATDTLINEIGLQPMISQLFLEGTTMNFTALNKRIYEEVFVTPRQDEWMGLAQPMGFTGLPGDGLSVVTKQ